MDETDETYKRVSEQVQAFNTKGVPVTPATRFQHDLEWDSLTVLNFVAEVEDEFDVLIPVNMQAEIETVGQLAEALEKIKA
jgi:acyl carrier protein